MICVKVSDYTLSVEFVANPMTWTLVTYITNSGDTDGGDGVDTNTVNRWRQNFAPGMNTLTSPLKG